MANENKNRPFGVLPWTMPNGYVPPAYNDLFSVGSSAEVFPGDAVCLDDAGSSRVVIPVLSGGDGSTGLTPANATDYLFGAAANYGSGSAGDEIRIYPFLPGSLFLIQAGGTTSLDHIGQCMDLTGTAGDEHASVLGLADPYSKDVLDVGSVGTTGHFKIISKHPNDAWGDYTRLICSPNEGLLFTGVDGFSS